MKSVDYHHFLLADALAHAERLIFVVRSERRTEDIHFITGHGVIQTELMGLLKMFGLCPSIQLGNSGVVICTIE